MTSALANNITLSPPAQVPDFASQTVNQDFVGFAFESWSMVDYAGLANAQNKEFSSNLISTFFDKTGVPVQLRAGGTSMDHVHYDPEQKVAITPDTRPKLSEPSTFGPPWLDSLKQFNNVRWTLQAPLANHKDGNTKNSVDFFKAMLQAIGGVDHLQAVEIGNESDLYEGQGFRDKGYGPHEYAAEWKKFANAILSETAIEVGKHFQACDFATGVNGRPRWSIEKVFDEKINERDIVKSVAGHYYQDADTKDLQKSLMNHEFTKTQISRFGAGIKFLHNNPHLPFILGEVGDLTGSGSISAGLGSALWAVDWSLTCMILGIARVNFQLGTGFQFAAWWPHSKRFGADVRGTFYGAAFVADFIGKEGNFRVAPLDQQHHPELIVYGGYHGGRLDKVAIVDLDLYSSGNGERPSKQIELHVPDGVRSVKVEKLTGADGKTQEKMRWADHVWTPESQGQPVKKYDDTKEHRVQGGSVDLKVYSTEALLVHLRR